MQSEATQTPQDATTSEATIGRLVLLATKLDRINDELNTLRAEQPERMSAVLHAAWTQAARVEMVSCDVSNLASRIAEEITSPAPTDSLVTDDEWSASLPANG